jgi:hypothetical protein
VQLEEIELPPARITQKGYSFLPLNEKGWLLGHEAPSDFTLVKYGDDRDETSLIWAALVSLPASISLEDYNHKNLGLDPRHKLTTHDVTSYSIDQAACARSHAVAEDYEAIRKSERHDVMILESVTVTCAHPGNKSVGVVVSFSQRYYPGHRDIEFIEKSESALKNIKFRPLR